MNPKFAFSHLKCVLGLRTGFFFLDWGWHLTVALIVLYGFVFNANVFHQHFGLIICFVFLHIYCVIRIYILLHLGKLNFGGKLRNPNFYHVFRVGSIYIYIFKGIQWLGQCFKTGLDEKWGKIKEYIVRNHQDGYPYINMLLKIYRNINFFGKIDWSVNSGPQLAGDC